MTDNDNKKLCNQINAYIKDETQAVLAYTKTLRDIEILPEIADKMIKSGDKDKESSIKHCVEKIIMEQAEHFMIWKEIGIALGCPEPKYSKDEAEGLGEALEKIGEILEEKAEVLEKKGEEFERKGEDIEHQAKEIL